VTTERQLSMSRGEIADAMYARVDTVDYQLGLRTLKNFRILRTGGVENRSGWRFVDETRFPAKRSRLITFKFSVSSGQTYSIELGDLYAEFVQNGARIVEAAQGVTAISKANPAVLTYVGADNYANGDDVIVTGGDMPEIIGRRLRVANVNVGANTFELQHTDGTNLNSTAFTTYTTGAVVAKIYKIATPYLEAELEDIRFDQSADVMVLTHKAHPIQELVRLGQTNWTMSAFVSGPTTAFPTGFTFAGGGAGALQHRYRVLSIDAATGRRSTPGRYTPLVISAITQANPAEITCTTNHYLRQGDQVTIGVGGSPVTGMTQVNGKTYTVVASVSATKFTIAVDSTGFGAYVAGGDVTIDFVRGTLTDGATSPTNIVTIDWNQVAGARHYLVYKEIFGTYEYIGKAEAFDLSVKTYFKDAGQPTDPTNTLPIEVTLFAVANDYPQCVCFAQGRVFFSRSNNKTTTLWGSVIGDIHDFSIHYPSVDNDAITLVLGGKEVNEVNHLLELVKLLIFSAGAELVSKGDTNGILRPGSPHINTHTYNGSGRVAPVIADANVIFVQADGSIPRDEAFDWQADGFRGKDLSIRSSHLFDGRTIAAMAYQRAPIPTVWFVLDDGKMLSLTYLREEQLVGFSRHETDGIVESMTVVPEGAEQAVYIVVKRQRIHPPTGLMVTRRYIERLEARYKASIKDAFHVDSGLTYDGRHTDGTLNVRLENGTTWDQFDGGIRVHASAVGAFKASDVGNQIQLQGTIAEHNTTVMIRATILTFIDSQNVGVSVNKLVPVGMRTVYCTQWAFGRYQIGGLFHLEGRQLSVLGDGGVVASPKTALLTVANGKVTLPDNEPRGVVHLGLPYFCDIETLDLDRPDISPRAGKRKNVTNLKIHVCRTIGGFVGNKPPTDDAVDPKENLEEIQYTTATEAADADPVMVTEVLEEPIRGDWTDHGRVFIRQMDPYPMSILAIIPDFIEA
jgi:hypothetical protein